MASVGDIEQARKNVRFLAETGLITDVELAKKILASKETPVLPRPSGLPNSPAVLPVPVMPEELLRRMSPEAINMIVNFEVNGRDGFEARFKNPVWVGGPGGVTIGIGYDLGSIAEDGFRRDWGSRLTSTELDQLALMVGLRGSAAKTAVARVSEITVRWEDALAVFTNSVLPRYATIVDAQLPNAKELPPDSYGALVSLVYNRGASFNLTGSRYDEMRNIRDLIDKRDFASISAQIRSMKRLWPDTPLSVRREREALLFEKGFAPDDAQIRGFDPQ
jgi:GH24 family phage-related lysozyme (muramidase)